MDRDLNDDVIKGIILSPKRDRVSAETCLFRGFQAMAKNNGRRFLNRGFSRVRRLILHFYDLFFDCCVLSVMAASILSAEETQYT